MSISFQSGANSQVSSIVSGHAGWLMYANPGVQGPGQALVLSGDVYQFELSQSRSMYGSEMEVRFSLPGAALLTGRPLEQMTWDALQAYPAPVQGRQPLPQMTAMRELARRHPGEYRQLCEEAGLPSLVVVPHGWARPGGLPWQYSSRLGGSVAAHGHDIHAAVAAAVVHPHIVHVVIAAAIIHPHAIRAAMALHGHTARVTARVTARAAARAARVVRAALAALLSRRPRISVITPTWQRRDLLLNRCVPSVLAQEYDGEIEHIIVSDGPDPALEDVPGVRFLDGHRAAPNRGIWARLAGTRAATGELVAYLDDDNAWRPRHLALLAAAIEREGVSFAHSRAACSNGNGCRWEIGCDPPVFGQVDTSLIVHRRGLLETANWEPSGVPADWHLADRWLRAGATHAFVPEITLDYYASTPVLAGQALLDFQRDYARVAGF